MSLCTRRIAPAVCRVPAEFAKMVRLRAFVLHTDEGPSAGRPWPHVPVAPSVAHVDGVRTVVVNPARAAVGVSPCPNPCDRDVDGAYSTTSDPSSDSDAEATRASARRAARHAGDSAPRAGADSGTAGGAHGSSTPPPDRCVRCGEDGHRGEACGSFPTRARGASRCADRDAPGRDIGSPPVARIVPEGESACVDSGDGPECLYLALTAALQAASPAARAVTRSQLNTYLSSVAGGRAVVDGHPLASWIRWEAEQAWTVKRYVTYMRAHPKPRPGLLEVAAFCALRSLHVDVWRVAQPGFLCLVASLTAPTSAPDAPTLNILHVDGRRYAAVSDLHVRASRRVRSRNTPG